MHMSDLKKMPALALAFLALALQACSGNGPESDAYGNFEADDVVVSSEASGKFVYLAVSEGDEPGEGMLVAVVDTAQLVLQRAQLEASKSAARARIPGVVAEMEVLEERRRVAEVERNRISNLVERQAATQKQLDDINGQLSVLERQMRSIRSRNAPILAEVEVLDAQIAQVEYQIERSRIHNPVRGTVLETYARNFEVTAAGRPVYKIAPTDTLTLRAYVSGSQLADIAVGNQVTVVVDGRGDVRELPGTITWIADEAEFTPKLIQTREERVNLVYAFKVRVANSSGEVKIGMPGEVRF